MTNRLYIKPYLLFAALLFGLAVQPVSYSQDIAAARERAIAAQAPLLAPDLFQAAERDRAAADSLDANLSAAARENAEQLFERAEQEARTRATQLRVPLEARRLARLANADTLFRKQWLEAENFLALAIDAIDRGRDNIVSREAGRAQQAYDAAEFAAIEMSILGTAREQLKSATQLRAQRFAPRTLQRGRDLVIQTRDLLSEDRYATDTATQLATQAEAYARRAIQISNLAREKPSLEDVILTWEARLTQLEQAGEQQQSSTFDPDERVALLEAEIERLRRQETELEQQVRDSQAFIAALEEEIRDLDDKLGGASAERRDLIIRLEAQARSREQLGQAKALFEPTEAQVFTQSDDIVVRLVGLKFSSGSSKLDAASDELLGKLAALLAIYPGSTIVIEGHTDSQGSENNNQRLSQARADTVLNRIVADMRIAAERLSAVGYGETRPIANNETSSGRTRNRRIDLIITPAPQPATP